MVLSFASPSTVVLVQKLQVFDVYWVCWVKIRTQGVIFREYSRIISEGCSLFSVNFPYIQLQRVSTFSLKLTDTDNMHYY